MNKAISIIILLHIVLQITVEALQINQNGCDGVDYFPDENDCTVFYRCVDYNTYSLVYRFTCGPGTVFDTRTNNCNFAYASGRPECYSSTQHHSDENTNENELETLSPNSSSSSNSNSNNNNISNKKEFFCEIEGYFANPADCKQFFRCVDSGQGNLAKYSFFCGEGTVWDQKLLTCNYPREVSDPACSMSTITVSSNDHASEVTTTNTNSIMLSSKPQSNKPSISNANTVDESTFKPESLTVPSSNYTDLSSTTDNSISQTTLTSTSTGGSSTQTTTTSNFESTIPSMTTTIISSTDNMILTTIAQNTTSSALDMDQASTAMTTSNNLDNSVQTTISSIDLTTKYSDYETNKNESSTASDSSTVTSSTPTVDVELTSPSSQSDIQDSASTTENSGLTSTEGIASNETDTPAVTMFSTTVSDGSNFSSTLASSTMMSTTTNIEVEPTTEGNLVNTQSVSTTETGESSITTADNFQMTTVTKLPDIETSTPLKDSNETETATTDAASSDSSTSSSTYTTTTENIMQSTSSDGITTVASNTLESNNMMSKVSTTTSSSITTTISPSPMDNDNSSCPALSENQMRIICPTGFRRHPKFCNVYYQCTISQNMLDFQMMSFVCSEGTIFDEDKVQCIPENESLTQCQSTIYKNNLRSNSNQLQMYTLFGKEPICPAIGHSAIEDDSDCMNLFVKCQKSSDKAKNKLEGFVFQCPDGFVFWKISRRCEPSSKIPECKTKMIPMLKSQLPVETENISRK